MIQMNLWYNLDRWLYMTEIMSPIPPNFIISNKINFKVKRWPKNKSAILIVMTGAIDNKKP